MLRRWDVEMPARRTSRQLASPGKQQGPECGKSQQVANPGKRLVLARGKSWQGAHPNERQDLASDKSWQVPQYLTSPSK